MTSQDDDGMQDLVNQVAAKCVLQLREERALADQNQLEQINQLLEHWSEQAFQKTKELVSKVSTTHNDGASNASNDAFAGTSADIRERQSNLLATVQDSHNKQLDILRTAIADERKQFAQAQLAFEQTLKTRYECMVDALHEKVKAEQEARMQRAIDNLERSARIESERAKQSFEIQQEAELTLSQKFKGIVSDLRRSWEEEETGRAMQLEERLRSHYSVVLEHMEAQLKMALRLQDDADKQWLEDVEARNQQQIQTLKAFEDKCKRLYDVRLTEYAEKTGQQIAQYEEQLLEAGTELASEKAQFESRLRRIKLACSRWKVAYQKDVHDRYQQMTNVLEERYMSEVAERLQEINDVKAALAEAQTSIQRKEQEIIKIHKMYAPGGSGADTTNGQSSSKMREDLAVRWNELKTPLADRVDCLSAMLDAAPASPEMVSRYESVVEKLAARQPIVQLASRKQFIEYKLKLATRVGPDGVSVATGVSPADRAALIAELTEVQSNTEALIRQYERRFGEAYMKLTGAGNGGLESAPATPAAAGNALGGAYGAAPATPSPHNRDGNRDSISWGQDVNPRASFTNSGMNTNMNNGPATRNNSIAGASGANAGAGAGAGSNANTNTGTSSSASAASYMSPLAASKMNNPAAATSASGSTKSAFKSIPPVR